MSYSTVSFDNRISLYRSVPNLKHLDLRSESIPKTFFSYSVPVLGNSPHHLPAFRVCINEGLQLLPRAIASVFSSVSAPPSPVSSSLELYIKRFRTTLGSRVAPPHISSRSSDQKAPSGSFFPPLLTASLSSCLPLPSVPAEDLLGFVSSPHHLFTMGLTPLPRASRLSTT